MTAYPSLSFAPSRTAETMSESTTYYSEYDPFDYLYSGSGTQYSDPVYEAVVRSDHTPMSPGSGEFLAPIFISLIVFVN